MLDEEYSRLVQIRDNLKAHTEALMEGPADSEAEGDVPEHPHTPFLEFTRYALARHGRMVSEIEQIVGRLRNIE